MTNKKRVAIVTGGAAGLGLAITRRLVSEGITTVMIGRNEKNLRQTAAELGSLCSYKVLDLQQVAAIPAFVQEIVTEFGQLDILVNNAGINHKKPFLEVTDDEFFQVIQTNVLSVFAMSREVARLMVVTALHHIPVGDIWSSSEIMLRKKIIAAAGMECGREPACS